MNDTGSTLNEVIWRSQKHSKKFILISVEATGAFEKKKKKTLMISSDVCFRDISLLALQRKSRGRKKDGLRVLECIIHCHGLAKVIISQDERNRKF